MTKPRDLSVMITRTKMIRLNVNQLFYLFENVIWNQLLRLHETIQPIQVSKKVLQPCANFTTYFKTLQHKDIFIHTLNCEIINGGSMS